MEFGDCRQLRELKLKHKNPLAAYDLVYHSGIPHLLSIDKITLVVPRDSVNKYRIAPLFSMFKEVVADDA